MRSCVTYITRGNTLASPSTFTNTAISRVIFPRGALWLGYMRIAPGRPDSCLGRSNAIARIPVCGKDGLRVIVSQLSIPARRRQYLHVAILGAPDSDAFVHLNALTRSAPLTRRPSTIPNESPPSLVYYPLHGCGLVLVAHHTKRTVA